MSSVFHRLTAFFPEEEAQVRATGQLWGRSARIIAGNGPPSVKAYQGHLPAGERGYTFRTGVAPSRLRNFIGKPGAEWAEGSDGVVIVSGSPDTVAIPVEVLDG